MLFAAGGSLIANDLGVRQRGDGTPADVDPAAVGLCMAEAAVAELRVIRSLVNAALAELPEMKTPPPPLS